MSVSTGNTAKMNAVVAALNPVETPANLTEITEDTDIDSLLAAHTKPVEPVKEIDLFALFTNV